MKNSLNFKISALMITVVIVFFSIFGYLDYAQKIRKQTNELHSKLLIVTSRLAQTLKNLIWDMDDINIADTITAEMQDKEILSIIIFDVISKEIIAGKTRNDHWNIINENKVSKDTKLKKRQEVIKKGKVIAYLDVQLTDKFIKEDAISTAITQAKFFFILMLVFAVLLTSTIYIAVLKPIKRLAHVIRSITEGNVKEDFETKRDDELGELAKDFSIMRATLDQKMQDLNDEIIKSEKVGKELKASEEKFRTLFDSSTDAMILFDPELGYQDCNPAALKMFCIESKYAFCQISASELSPEFQPDGTHSETSETEKFRIALTQGSCLYEWVYKNLEGKEFYTIVLIIRIELADKIILHITIRDVTKRKRVEEEVLRLRNYLSNIVNSMPSALVGVSTDGIVTQWNSEAQRMTGINSDEAVGQQLQKVFPRLSSEMNRVRKAILTKQEQHDHRRILYRNGKKYFENVTVFPLVTNGVEGAVIRIDDVTNQVRIEEMMVQSEKMLSIGGLAAGMAHEINNPLGGMMQTAFVMSNRLTNLELPANIRAANEAGISMNAISTFMKSRNIINMLNRISDSGKRAAEIITNMLNFARKSDSSHTSCILSELLDQCINLAGADYNLKKKYDFRKIEIIREYENELPSIFCESGEIKQVVLNILRNGAEAMKDTMVDNNGKKPRFILRLAQEKEMVRIEIEDNGPGMDEETSKRIFDPFFTTKKVGEGTGLGLSVSYFIIVENHSGNMSVESTPGEGTKFIIGLPINRQ